MQRDNPWISIADNIILISNVYHNLESQCLSILGKSMNPIEWIGSSFDRFQPASDGSFSGDLTALDLRVPPFEKAPIMRLELKPFQIICPHHLCQRKQSLSIMCCKTNFSAKVPKAISYLQNTVAIRPHHHCQNNNSCCV